MAAFLNALHLLDAHNGLITALATVVIGAFTVMLAKVSIDQGRLLKKSADAAATTALATMAGQRAHLVATPYWNAAGTDWNFGVRWDRTG
ncbi:MAG TPA: hypothetical protein PLY97_11085 [Acidocella sp.]|nr:hypothetical protein [Acidocella sp.]